MTDDTGMGPAPPETVALWVSAVRRTSREAIESFVQRTWARWDPASLGPVRAAVDARRAELDAQ
jgi:uncharacterized protein YbdZ (MbtH family)